MAYGCLVILPLFVEKTIFSHIELPWYFIEIQSISVYFRTRPSAPLICSLHLPHYHTVWVPWFYKKLWNWVKPPTSFFSFLPTPNSFVYPRDPFHVNFTTSLSISTKKACWDFARTKLTDLFGKNGQRNWVIQSLNMEFLFIDLDLL